LIASGESVDKARYTFPAFRFRLAK